MTGAGDLPSEPQDQQQQRSTTAREALRSAPSRERALHRARTGLFAALQQLRFVSERPASLIDHLDYAQRGEWTVEVDGYCRSLGLLYAWLIAIPISALAYFTAWASARPGRFISVLAVFMLVNTALIQIPGLRWLIAPWATVPYWLPF